MSGFPPGVVAAVVIPNYKELALAEYNKRFAKLYVPQTRLGASAAAKIEKAIPYNSTELFGSQKNQFEEAISSVPNGPAVLKALETNKRGLEYAVNSVISETGKEAFYEELYEKMLSIMGGKRKKSRKSKKSKKSKKSRKN
jgi:hypothetical protein